MSGAKKEFCVVVDVRAKDADSAVAKASLILPFAKAKAYEREDISRRLAIWSDPPDRDPRPVDLAGRSVTEADASALVTASAEWLGDHESEKGTKFYEGVRKAVESAYGKKPEETPNHNQDQPA